MAGWQRVSLGSVARPFHWGVLIVGDRYDAALPDLGPGPTIGVGRCSITIPVRHAQDTDSTDCGPFAVNVTCTLIDGEYPAGAAEAVVNLPSGVLAIGDADEAEYLDVQPGLWRIVVDLHPTDHPEEVKLSVSKA
ncbi:MAG: hypothetical protein AAF962_27980 [Actinomycetota bacterium]